VSDHITEDWLRACGFRWSQEDRQPHKHWLLWLADACVDREGRRVSASDDLGIELTLGINGEPWWYCWVRADYAGRYTRFLHIRHMTTQAEVVQLIEAMTGRPWDPADVFYGALRSPEQAEHYRRDEQRLDKRLAKAWGERVDKELGLDPAKDERVGP